MAKKCGFRKEIFKDVKLKKITASGKGRKKPMAHDIFQFDDNYLYNLFFGKQLTAEAAAKKGIKNFETFKKIKKNLDKAQGEDLTLISLGQQTTTRMKMLVELSR